MSNGPQFLLGYPTTFCKTNPSAFITYPSHAKSSVLIRDSLYPTLWIHFNLWDSSKYYYYSAQFPATSAILAAVAELIRFFYFYVSICS